MAQTSPTIAEADYKNRHIPHRINLLITYRDRFVPLTKQQREYVRDLDRCAKDISAMMVRRLLGEMGIALKRGNPPELKRGEEKSTHALELTVDTIRQDGKEDLIREVLVVGNRAIAHIEPADVDHSFRTEVDDLRLVEAISYVEDKVIKHVYRTRADYDLAMKLAGNDMHRNRFNLTKILPRK